MKSHKFLSKVIQNGLVYCARASNGLFLLLKVLDFRNKVIIFPDILCHGPVVAAASAGYETVFSDVSLDNFSYDLKALEDTIKRTKASVVFAPHMFGYPCSLNAIANLCKKYNAFLIEDAAQAYGLHLFSKELVGVADATLYSFGHSKIISAGGGGIVSSSDASLLKNIEKAYRSLYFLDENDERLINLYKDKYYDIDPKFGKKQYSKLFKSLTPIYQKRPETLNFEKISSRLEQQISIFNYRQELFAKQCKLLGLDFGFDFKKFVPWRLSFLFSGDRRLFSIFKKKGNSLFRLVLANFANIRRI